MGKFLGVFAYTYLGDVMRKNRVFCALFIILIVILLSSCTESIKIGANIELSGVFAPYGQPAKDALILATDEINESGGINGVPVEIVFADNRSSAVESVGATLFLKQKGASAIFGPTISTLVKASLCADTDVVLITPSATADDLVNMKSKTTLFRMCFNDTAQGGEMAKFANNCGHKTALVLCDLSSDYSTCTTKAFVNNFSGESTVRYFLSGDTDFSAILHGGENFDCIYLPAYYTEAAAIIKRARQLGVGCAILSGDAIDSPLVFDIVGDEKYLNNVFYTAHAVKSESYLNFEKTFFETFGYKPNTYAALMYDSAKVYFETLKKDIQNVEKELYNTNGYKGICGEITISENGECLKKPVVTAFGG